MWLHVQKSNLTKLATFRHKNKLWHWMVIHMAANFYGKIIYILEKKYEGNPLQIHPKQPVCTMQLGCTTNRSGTVCIWRNQSCSARFLIASRVLMSRSSWLTASSRSSGGEIILLRAIRMRKAFLHYSCTFGPSISSWKVLRKERNDHSGLRLTFKKIPLR